MEKDRTIVQGFQGLRGFAILLIVISHCCWTLNEHGNNILTYAGAWGVSCFIMLSGFLAVDRYYGTDFGLSDSLLMIKRKIRKCYPLHLLTFIVAVPFSAHAFQFFWKTLLTAIFNLTLTQALVPLPSVYFSFNSVSWYLSLDIILVLFLPFTLKILTGMNPKILICTIFIVFILQAAIVMATRQTVISHWISYICPVTRVLDYLVGGGVALASRKTPGKKDCKYKWMIHGSLILGILILLISMPMENKLFCTALWTIPTAFLILGIYKTEKDKNILFQFKPLIWVGNISFELFLCHQLVIRYCTYFVSKLGMKVTWWMYTLMILLSVIVAFVCSQRRKIINWM